MVDMMLGGAKEGYYTNKVGYPLSLLAWAGSGPTTPEAHAEYMQAQEHQHARSKCTASVCVVLVKTPYKTSLHAMKTALGFLGEPPSQQQRPMHSAADATF